MTICWGTTALLALIGRTGESLAIPDGATAALLLAYGLTAQVAGWLLISHGLPHVEASRAGLVLLHQPSLAFGWDILFFARPTGGMDVVGAVLALGATIWDGRRAEGREDGTSQDELEAENGLPCDSRDGSAPARSSGWPPSPVIPVAPATPVLAGVLVYILLQLALGFWVSRRVKTEDDYLVAGRRLGFPIVMFTVFATWFGAETCIGSAGEAYRAGLSGTTADPFGYAGCLLLMGLVYAAYFSASR
jgi:hypothetical protein